MNSVVFVRRASCWSATVVFDGNWNSHVAPAKLGTAGRGLSGKQFQRRWRTRKRCLPVLDICVGLRAV